MKKYGIKAYGDWTEFDTKKAFQDYLLDWMSATEGAERDRAVEAFTNLKCGINRTDTDAM